MAVVLASAWLVPRLAHDEACGPLVDVITAPSHKVGGHSCDSDRDGALEDSKCCRCDDCAIHPESCDRKGDRAFSGCDLARQHCAPRPCIATGRCAASDPTSYTWTIDCNDYNRARFPGNCEICADRVDDDCDGSATDCATNADGDADGFSPPEDCNDRDPSIHPGAFDLAATASIKIARTAIARAETIAIATDTTTSAREAGTATTSTAAFTPARRSSAAIASIRIAAAPTSIARRRIVTATAT